MKNVPENELFSAYLDGELTAEEQAQMERLLAASPKARQLLESLRTLSATLQSLPVHKLDEDLSQSVLRLAERQMLSESPPSVPSGLTELPSPRDGLRSDDLTWRPSLRRLLRPRNLVFPGVAVAIALLLTLTERFGPNQPGARRVAMAPSAVREEAAPAEGEKEARELPAIGPLHKAARPVAPSSAPADSAENRRLREDAVADGKSGAGMLNSPVISSTPANVTPSAAADRSSMANLLVPGMAPAETPSAGLAGAPPSPSSPSPAARPMKSAQEMAPAAPPAEPAMPGVPAQKSDAESLARRAASPSVADKAALSERAKESKPSEPQGVEVNADRVASGAAAGGMGYLLKGRKTQLDTLTRPMPEPALVVRCDVSRPAVARGLLEQILAKQQIGLRDLGRRESASSVGGQHDLDRVDGGRFEVEASPAQLHRALAELQAHPEVFVSYSMESRSAPAGSAQAAEESEKDLKKQAELRDELKIAGKSPAAGGDSTATRPLGKGVAAAPSVQDGQASTGASQSVQRSSLAGQSQMPVRSQLAQQVMPSQQLPASTSQAGVAKQMITLPEKADRTAAPDDVRRAGGGQIAAKAENAIAAPEKFRRNGQEPSVAQTLPDGVKQRVVFILRLTAPSATGEAAQLAGPKKAKAAAAKVAEPAKPADAAPSPLPVRVPGSSK